MTQRPRCGVLTAHKSQIAFKSDKFDELKLFMPILPEPKGGGGRKDIFVCKDLNFFYVRADMD